MLTKRQNMLETIRGGNPDRFVNQFEALKLVRSQPFNAIKPHPAEGGAPEQDGWNVWWNRPVGQLGGIPMHDPEHILVTDICNWRDVVKHPRVRPCAADWEPAIAEVEQIDRSEYFVGASFIPGIFEVYHSFMGMGDAMVNFYEEPEHAKDLLKYIQEYEMYMAEQMCSNLHIDAVFHHDDWGSSKSLLMSVEMFEEFIMPLYRELYGFMKANGVEVIIHHSDSFGEPLVPKMHELGIDVWQGVVTNNDVPGLIKRHGSDMTYMGYIETALCDIPDWDRATVERLTRQAVEAVGDPRCFIPCLTQGGPSSSIPGVYDAVSETIRQINCEKFGIPVGDQ